MIPAFRHSRAPEEVTIRLDARSILPALALIGPAVGMVTLGRWIRLVDDRPEW